MITHGESKTEKIVCIMSNSVVDGSPCGACRELIMQLDKDSKNIDIGSLNSILSTGKKLINIGYLMAIVALVLLATYIMKEWHVFGFIKELIMVISLH